MSVGTLSEKDGMCHAMTHVVHPSTVGETRRSSVTSYERYDGTGDLGSFDSGEAVKAHCADDSANEKA